MIKGINFDYMKVQPSDDAMINFASTKIDGIIKGYRKELKVSSSGLTITVQPGGAMIRGRGVEVTTTESIIVPPNGSGYIVLTIDLSKSNSFTGIPGEDNYTPKNNQVRLERVDDLVKQDVFEQGKIYMLPIASYRSAGTITSLTQMDVQKFYPTLQNGFGKYPTGGPNELVLYKSGETVHIFGRLTNATLIKAGASVTIAQGIPKEFRPMFYDEELLCQGSGGSIWLCTISPTDGSITFSRHRNGADYVNCTSNSYLAISGTWMSNV